MALADTIERYLGDETGDLLEHRRAEGADGLRLPGPDFVERALVPSDRSPAVMRNLQTIFDHGVEHGAGADFAREPAYFDPENIVRLAIEGGCSAVASTLGVGATVYFGLPESRRQIREVSSAFRRAHALGMVTVLWAYVRNPAFMTSGVNYERAANLTGQANHLGATIEADLVKQKQAETNSGFKALNFGKTDERMYTELSTDHPIDLVRYQVMNCYLGRAGLINLVQDIYLSADVTIA